MNTLQYIWALYVPFNLVDPLLLEIQEQFNLIREAV
jgi:hypothetical protein